MLKVFVMSRINFHEYTFGEFDLQVLGGDLPALQALRDIAENVGRKLELDPRKIHRNDVWGDPLIHPNAVLATSLLECPTAKFQHIAAAFGDRNEESRRNDAAHRMAPAQQGFKTDDATGE